MKSRLNIKIGQYHQVILVLDMHSRNNHIEAMLYHLQ